MTIGAVCATGSDEFPVQAVNPVSDSTITFSNAGRRFVVPVGARTLNIFHDGAVVVVIGHLFTTLRYRNACTSVASKGSRVYLAAAISNKEKNVGALGWCCRTLPDPSKSQVHLKQIFCTTHYRTTLVLGRSILRKAKYT